VAFISEFVDGDRVFRYVDAGTPTPVKVGGGDPLEDSYCQRVVDGRLPQLIHDACALPAALEIAATTELPVGAHVSVPLTLADGRGFGTFCCFSGTADQSLTGRDLAVVRVFADVAQSYLEADLAAARVREEVRARVDEALTADDGLVTVYQPVIALDGWTVLGVEALSRFPRSNVRTPDMWFAEAASIGLGAELELRALRSALVALQRLPGDLFLSVNLSPAVVLERGRLEETFDGVDLRRVVLEMTEHAPVDDYHELGAALRPFRDRGLRIAVDDAGAGYASLRHILWLTPDWIKLDISITRDIDSDAARAALASALIGFAAKVGSSIIAEGIETDAELEALASLGATAGQGYHLGRPTTLEEAIKDRSTPSVAPRERVPVA
jgi:EAL domain-containing protein (putative c-di-GMP-specific phosphodiesterase class I)